MHDDPWFAVSPAGWRGLLGPVAAGWAACCAAGLARLGWLQPPHLPTAEWATAVVLAALALAAWCAAGAAGMAAARLAETMLLAHWERLGAPVVSARRRAWDGLTRRADACRAEGDHDATAASIRRRAAISLARPVAASWIADRWASLAVRVSVAYGLDVASTWPRLWLLLGEDVRAELRAAQAAWRRACLWTGWALLYALAGILWWPALLGSVVFGLWGWAAARRSIAGWAELIESAYDLYGAGLPQEFGTNPSDGQEITARIRKGS